ncbi:MAG: alpha-N-arabinofuranosidase [Prevotella sp.]|nr:alpha-N-arabinofuranosidase [Prevotella sp.]
MLRRLFSVVVIMLSAFSSAKAQQQLFFYCPEATKGLHVAHLEKGGWRHVAQLFASDYGEWGAEKRMYSPFIHHSKDGTWRAVFQVNDSAPCFAATYSDDLVTWRPQDYPRMGQKGCFSPVIIETQEGVNIYFASAENGMRMTAATPDFRHFSPDRKADRAFKIKKDRAVIEGTEYEGQQFQVEDSVADKLLAFHHQQQLNSRRFAETMKQDADSLLPFLKTRMIGGAPTAIATLIADPVNEKSISDKLIGVFFEDINYAADGGIYAELIQNRDFEYSARDYSKKGKTWISTTAWLSSGPFNVATEQPLSEQNPHYLVLSVDTLYNTGFDGIAVKKNARYVFSFFVRNISGSKKSFTVVLKTTTKEGETSVTNPVILTTKGKNWVRYEAEITATADCADARLAIIPKGKSKAAVDMVSLMPTDTYHGHGLRKDIAEAIAAIHPKFVRFPGGCMTHGQGIDNIYHWHHSIGEWQHRQPDMNIWGYHQTRGLGFFEYFQWCEDMGAEPLPVLAAGVPCQNSKPNADAYGGQQGGIPMEEMKDYAEEICHLIEWANGDPTTNEWAKLRAEAGHPAPFHLKYIGIGNEDLVSTAFEERCLLIAKTVRERYPDIQICGTVGPFHAPSSDYMEGWKFANEHRHLFNMVDEHYYESTGWFLNNQQYYDNYDRKAPKVYLGEYASWSRTVESALTEAIHLCNVERNGDVVAMTSYAPLLCNTKHQNWNPDLIYFDNLSVTTTPSYETQRLFGTYCGDRYIHSEIKADGLAADTRHQATAKQRIAASIIRDSKTGNRYLRLVNALPVQLKVSLQGVTLPKTYTVTGFHGMPTDESAAPIHERQRNTGSVLLKPYSMVVIGI